MGEKSVAIELRGLRRTFGEVVAVNNVSLDVYDGEFLTLLGPSGSGKTTVLRLIAGFERPDSGSIKLDGVDVTDMPPYERNVNTVFQDYALFPHMSVAENISYGLKVKKVPKSERADLVANALESVRLSGYGDRAPSQLSGGQRQRVALARALVNRPKVLLLDEPLGALDLKLREEMQIELKELQRSVGITFVFVTHDQDEALTMSDRIAVFNEGDIAQLGSPINIYEQPATPFVAGFVGVSNLITGDLAKSLFGSEGTWSVRPEKITITETPASVAPGDQCVNGRVHEVIYAGMSTRYLVDLPQEQSLSVVIQNSTERDTYQGWVRGSEVQLTWNSASAKALH